MDWQIVKDWHEITAKAKEFNTKIGKKLLYYTGEGAGENLYEGLHEIITKNNGLKDQLPELLIKWHDNRTVNKAKQFRKYYHSDMKYASQHLTPAQFGILILFDTYTKKEGYSDLSVKKAAEIFNCDLSNMYKIVKELTELGHLVIEKKGFRGRTFRKVVFNTDSD